MLAAVSLEKLQHFYLTALLIREKSTTGAGHEQYPDNPTSL